MRRRVSMREVAAAAGYSKATVSLALRGDPSIPERTRERVRKVAQELGYVIDPVVAGLAARRWAGLPAGRRHQIAYISHYHWRGHQDYKKVLAHAQDEAKELGYKLERFHRRDYPSGKALERVLAARGIRGILLGPVTFDPDELDLDWKRFAVVCLGIGIHSPGFHTVKSDSFHAFIEAFRRMEDAGCKRIGMAFKMDRPKESDHGARKLGAAFALQHLRATRTYSPPPHFQVGGTKAKQVAALAKWIRAHQLDGVIGEHRGFCEHIIAGGFKVPDELRVVCELPAHEAHPFGGFAPDAHQLGRVGVELLDELLRRGETGMPSSPREILIKTQWWGEGKDSEG